MVDPTTGIGSIQNIQSGSRTTNNNERENVEQAREGELPRDEVSISEEAINLQQAEQAATEAREGLSRDEELTLAAEEGRERLEELA